MKCAQCLKIQTGTFDWWFVHKYGQCLTCIALEAKGSPELEKVIADMVNDILSEFNKMPIKWVK